MKNIFNNIEKIMDQLSTTMYILLILIFGFIYDTGCKITPKIHNLMDWMGRYRIINDRENKEPYLERYYLFLKDRQNFPFNIFIHKFLKSDPDDLHDHPWPYITIILKGGYWEYTYKDETKNVTIGEWKGPGSILYRSAESFHRIEIDENQPATWTLFMPGKKMRDWGFQTNDGWIKNEDYLKIKKKY